MDAEALPYTSFTFAAIADVLSIRKPTRKPGFDQRPVHGEVRIIFRQRPDGVEMVRKHYHSINVEGVVVPGLTNAGA